MNEQFPMVNIGDLARPATVLIEKISEVIGGCFKPYQIRRVAQAEAEAEKIRATTQIEITDLQHRAMQRFFVEEAKKQNNIESITTKALPQLDNDADPRLIEDDWITNFFDRCRLISDDEMQNLWAKVLAGEANSPGRFSKRTVNMLGTLDKSDAELFTKLCGFVWFFETPVPLIYGIEVDIYNRHDINFSSLKHLDEIGLVSVSSIGGFSRRYLPQRVLAHYYETSVVIQFEKESENELDVGVVLFSRTGEELAAICGSRPIPGFVDYVVEKWVKKRYVLSSPYPRGKRDSQLKTIRGR
jgi:hypothetical protein